MREPEKIKSIFNHIACRYDIANHLLSFGLDRCWRKKLVKLSNPKPGNKILDICCGTGDQAIAFAEFNSGLDIAGYDFSEEMIEIAKAKAGEIEFLIADCTDTDLSAETFDIISCSFGIRNIIEFNDALKHAYKLLRPGGRLAILEFNLPKSLIIRTFYNLYLHYLLPLIGGIITGRHRDYKYLSESVEKWSKQVDLPDSLRQTGFEKVETVDLSFSIVKAYIALK